MTELPGGQLADVNNLGAIVKIFLTADLQLSPRTFTEIVLIDKVHPHAIFSVCTVRPAKKAPFESVNMKSLHAKDFANVVSPLCIELVIGEGCDIFALRGLSDDVTGRDPQ